MVRALHRARYAEPEPEAQAPAVTPEDIVLLREIRDALKK